MPRKQLLAPVLLLIDATVVSEETKPKVQNLMHSFQEGLVAVFSPPSSWPKLLQTSTFGKWRLVDSLSVFDRESKDLVSKVLLLRHRGESGRFTRLSYCRQSSSDILLSTKATQSEDIANILFRLKGDCAGYYTLSVTGNEVGFDFPRFVKINLDDLLPNSSIIKRVVLPESPRQFALLDDEEVDQLSKGMFPKPKPIKVTAIGDEIPDGIQEHGIGEHSERKDHSDYYSKEEQERERLNIHSIIEERFAKIDRSMARRLGFGPVQLENYKILLKRKWKAFGTEDSLSCLSHLTPFDVNLKPGARILYVRRTIPLNQEKIEFLGKHLKMVLRKGLIEPVKNPKFGCAIFLAPKKGPKKWRMVAGMVPLNACCEKTPLQMPLLEQMLGFLGKSKIFSTWDMLSGFNLLRTVSKLFVIITPFGAFRMVSAPMGWLNTPAIFQDRIVTEVLIPADLYLKYDNGAGNWKDDTVIYGDNSENFLDGS